MTGVCTLLRVLQRLHWPDTLPGMWPESLQLQGVKSWQTPPRIQTLVLLLVWGSSQKHVWSVISCGNSGKSHKAAVSMDAVLLYALSWFVFVLLTANVHPSGNFPSKGHSSCSVGGDLSPQTDHSGGVLAFITAAYLCQLETRRLQRPDTLVSGQSEPAERCCICQSIRFDHVSFCCLGYFFFWFDCGEQMVVTWVQICLPSIAHVLMKMKSLSLCLSLLISWDRDSVLDMFCYNMSGTSQLLESSGRQ